MRTFRFLIAVLIVVVVVETRGTWGPPLINLLMGSKPALAAPAAQPGPNPATPTLIPTRTASPIAPTPAVTDGVWTPALSSPTFDWEDKNNDSTYIKASAALKAGYVLKVIFSGDALEAQAASINITKPQGQWWTLHIGRIPTETKVEININGKVYSGRMSDFAGTHVISGICSTGRSQRIEEVALMPLPFSPQNLEVYITFPDGAPIETELALGRMTPSPNGAGPGSLVCLVQ